MTQEQSFFPTTSPPLRTIMEAKNIASFEFEDGEVPDAGMTLQDAIASAAVALSPSQKRNRSKSRSPSPSGYKRSRKQHHGRDGSHERDRDRDKNRNRNRGTHRINHEERERSRSRMNGGNPERSVIESNPAQLDAAAEEDDDTFRKRVEEQMARIQAEQHGSSAEERSRETAAEERKRRRQELLAQFADASHRQRDGDDHKLNAADSATTETNSTTVAASGPLNINKKGGMLTEADAVPDYSDDSVMAAAHQQRLSEAQSKREAVVAVANAGGDAADDFDMFADSPSKIEMAEAKKHEGIGQDEVDENWDDPEGYYRFRRGDVLAGRYVVFALQGSGVFSTVVRVQDKQSDRDSVVKIIRNIETMQKAGMKEKEYLDLLASKDPENKKHVVRLLGDFEHRGHLCLVFEPFYKNLREVLRKFGNVGVHIDAVRSYAKQLFIALKHMKRCSILHADIKPDNILVNEDMSVVKICDFGSAGTLPISADERTPYLVSRFYRPPEVILGLMYNEQVDMWSIGCVLYELYTGKILFSGDDNNEMLKLQMALKGGMSKKLIKKGLFHEKHFNKNLVFEEKKVDRHSGLELTEAHLFLKPVETVREKLMRFATKQDRKHVEELSDLLDKVFTLNPEKRLGIDQALHHPFIRKPTS